MVPLPFSRDQEFWAWSGKRKTMPAGIKDSNYEEIYRL
jgi:hypothetical protein